ncbi:butyrate kinase [Hathewaya proteolytica DSM 3090]|uniref:Probable butyrate kinase n=1 Tax=Hathewaya proteolytica DSM 3090 TaxID=1121331 RepID=A0A1M6RF53_9CLOT|nr:butyrate kinase [Hathewaya proteolytica]SHK31105.1 butyrate kinase [Hathewaya proteolytica DSM 3090]
MNPSRKNSKIYPKILVVNVKLNSTVVCVYEGEENIFADTIWYSNQEMRNYITIEDQISLRIESVEQLLKNKRVYFDEIEGLVCRGFIVDKACSGTYVIDGNLYVALNYEDLTQRFNESKCLFTEPLLAYELCKKHNVSGYMVTTVNIDEMISQAKITGMKGIERDSFFNALTQKTVAKRFCKHHNKKYEKTNLIVAYLGNRMTIAAHKMGRVIEVNNTSEGEGPFSPERTGNLPMRELVKMCFSGNYIYEELKEIVQSRGGCTAYFGYKDFKVLMENVQKGDEMSKVVFDAMAYNICKEIAKCAIALEGQVYSIILTGRIAHSKIMVENIRNRVSSLAGVHVYAGKEEITNLVEEVLQVLRGEEKEIIYKG